MQTLAIIGNPNSGKTTLFNCLTGSNQHVGNWPGVTVERKTGRITHVGRQIDVVDLPGIYSLSPYTQEEIIARSFVLSSELDGILNIVDATNLERNLYLTMQLIELGLPMVIALNFIDALEAQQIHIDCEKLSTRLGVRVFPISARHGKGILPLLDVLTSSTNEMHPPTHQPAYPHGVSTAIGQGALVLAQTNLRACSCPFYAEKCLENDLNIRSQIVLTPEQEHQLSAIRNALCAHEVGQDTEMLFAGAFYDYIEAIVSDCVTRPLHPKPTVTDRIDRIIMHKWFALPIFLAVMTLMFWTTFGPIGQSLKGALEGLLQGVLSPKLESFLLTSGASDWVISLVCDGILGGVGGVLSFLPQIILLFFFLAMMEDTGYLARIAFIMDTLLRHIGLSGKSFVPMLMGFGCTTPAVMAARTMENDKDRHMTILLTPFMSCGAKLPVYALIAGAIFGKHAGFVIISLYIFGILMSIFSGFLLKKTVFRDVSSGFVLELPPYRLPTFKGTVRSMVDKAMDFITRAGTLIFLMSILIWLLQNITPTLSAASTPESSILGMFGRFLAPLFSPLGFGMWQASVALLAGLIAKEAVVSTMLVLYGVSTSAALSDILSGLLSPAAAYAFLVFILLYMPCMSAFATIKRELGSWRWAFSAAAFQTLLAWITSFVVYHIGMLVF